MDESCLLHMVNLSKNWTLRVISLLQEVDLGLQVARVASEAVEVVVAPPGVEVDAGASARAGKSQWSLIDMKVSGKVGELCNTSCLQQRPVVALLFSSTHSTRFLLKCKLPNILECCNFIRLFFPPSGVFICRGKEDALVTKNMVIGESVYGEKRMNVEEGETKIEYRAWNPFRSKLAAAILGGVDQIHIKPGSKVMYLGAASGTTVSHVSDIVGPVSIFFCT